MTKSSSQQLLFVLGIVVLFASCVVAQRSTISFDKDWLFLRGEIAGAEAANFNDSGWRKLDVPHDWSIEGPFDAKNPTAGSGGFLPSGVGWYRKHFKVAANQKDKRIFIEFDGVMANSDVWINGVHLGKRPNGYVSFGYELTDHIKFGGDNVIAVRADNSGQPASRWYTGAGIYRHVRLVTTNAVYVDKWSTFVTTPHVDQSEAVVKIATDVSNQSAKEIPAIAQYKILDSNGKVIARTESRATAIEAGQTGTIYSELKVAKPALWSLETPQLYKAVVTVLSNGRPVDSETFHSAFAHSNLSRYRVLAKRKKFQDQRRLSASRRKCL
jgi:beta-galactosidase